MEMSRNRAKWALLGAVVLAALLAACSRGGDGPEDAADDAARAHLTDAEAPSTYLCLACHSQGGTVSNGIWGISRELQGVAPDAFFTSAHGEMSCAECHEGQTALPHEKFSGTGEPLVLARDGNVCRTCHGGTAEHFLDSVHGTAVRLGDERAPACTDCHSVHAVQPIKTWTASEKATACAKCHDGADATFAGALTHVEPTVDRLPVDYIATRFFGALLVAVVGVGILHVELDILRWLKEKLTRKSREGK